MNSAFAEVYKKNGFPCVSEVCIGDGLEEVSRVQWERARNTFSSKDKPLFTSARKVSEGEIKILKSSYSGDVTAAGAYLYTNEFDAQALSGLAKVNAACEIRQLAGKYTTASGNLTRVSLALIPEPGNPSIQK